MRNLLFILLTILLFFSCEYDSDNIHYKEIEPPQDIQIGIDLAGVHPDDTIYIYTNTRLYYSLDTQGKEVLIQKFTLDGASVGMEDNTMSIYGADLDDKVHKLSVKIELKTNTGSLAEIIGFEKYLSEISYNLKFVKDVELKLNVRQEITPEGYLKLIWDRPNLKQTPVEYYEISYFDNISLSWVTSIIKDENQTFLLDKGYTYGSKSFEIKTYFVNNKINSWREYYYVKYEPITEDDINIELISKDKMLFSWKKLPFNNKVILTWFNREVYYLDANESSVEVNDPGFPAYGSYSLYFLPLDADTDRYEQHSYVSQTYRTPFFEYHPFSITYNASQNIFYGLTHYGGSYISMYDGHTFKLINNFVVPSTDTGGRIVTSSKTNKVAYSDTNDKIWVFSDNSFKTPQMINSGSADLLNISDDNKLLLRSEYEPFRLQVYHTDGYALYSIQGTENSLAFGLSSDGKYAYSFVYEDYPELKIYELKDTRSELIYTYKTGLVWGMDFAFNPLNSSQIVVSGSNEFYMLDILDETISAKIKGKFQSIDFVTGNILYKDENYIDDHIVHIRNNTLDKLLFTQPISNTNPHSDLLLVNNILIQNASCRDLSPYLKK